MASIRTYLQTLGAPPDRVRRWGQRLLFGGLLAAATWAVIAPLWVGPMPPLTDFGGHAAIADVWARLDTVAIYRDWYVRRGGLVPNTLPSRFAGLLFPTLGPVASLRLFTSLMLAATVAALVGVAKAFGRSPWLVFLCVPFLWNTGLHWGMVNYVAALPPFFAAIALARKAGQTDDWRWGVGLALACVFAFFAHGLGCAFTLGVAAFVLALSFRRPRALRQFAALIPAGGLWWHWKSMPHHGSGLPKAGLMDLLAHHSQWYDPKQKLARFFEHALNISSGDQEIVLICVLFGVWLLWMGVSQRPPAPAAPACETDAPLTGRLGRAARSLYAQLNEHTLLLVTLCLGAAIALLPSHIAQTNIATRVVPLFIMTAALLPRLPRRSWLAGAGLAVAIAAPFWFGHFATKTITAFDHTEFEPLEELIAHIPHHSRVECFGLPGYNGLPIQGSPLNHNCAGLVQVQTQSIGGSNFPATAFNAVAYRKGHKYYSLKHTGFRDHNRVSHWDYVITRGKRRHPPKTLATLVATAHPSGKKGPNWYLWRVEVGHPNAQAPP